MNTDHNQFNYSHVLHHIAIWFQMSIERFCIAELQSINLWYLIMLSNMVLEPSTRLKTEKNQCAGRAKRAGSLVP